MPRKAGPKIRRIEFSLFREGDPALAELEQEAEARGVSLQQHLYDLLRARYNGRRGVSTAAMFWAGVEATAPAPPAEPESPTNDAASSAAAAWLDFDE